MVDVLVAVVLGIVQGITEWLPVSSKGNVAILGQFFGLGTREAFSFAIILHVGTLISAAFYFRKDIIEMAFGKEKEKRNFILWTLVATALTALPSYFLLKKILETASINVFGVAVFSQTIFLIAVSFFLLVTGVLQLAKKTARAGVFSTKNAVLLGLAQGFTVLPGMSRSGTTASAMLFEGFSPQKAFELSFLISVPAVLLGELSFNFLEKPLLEPSMVFGVIASAVVGYFSIGVLIDFAKRVNFGKFCIALGASYFLIAVLSVALPKIA